MQFCDNCGARVESVSEERRVRQDAQNKNRQADGRRIQNEGQPSGGARRAQHVSRQDGSRKQGMSSWQNEGQPSGMRRSYNGQQPQEPRRQNGPNRPERNTQQYAYREDPRYSRYRQEELDEDWQQSWERQASDPDETHGFTPIQYVLLGITGLLLIALLTFGAFWLIGRSSNKSDADRGSGQRQTQQEESAEIQSGDGIEILDDTAKKPEGNEASPQSETPVQTEAPDIQLNYQEFTLKLPGSWKGKYGITQGTNSYTFYQMASKSASYGGTLFTIAKYTDTSYKNLPNYELLGTGGGAAFVCYLPSDVQYDAANTAAAQEYKTMAADVAQIRSSVKLLVSGEGPKETETQPPIEIIDSSQQQTQPQTQPQTQAPSGGGYLAESSQRLMTDADVAGMSYDDLQMAINEIYARHGRKFSLPEVQSYFESQSWYQGTVEPENFSDSVFSSTEAQNIQFLLGKMGVQ